MLIVTPKKNGSNISGTYFDLWNLFVIVSSLHRLYSHRAKLQSIRWYKAGGRIAYQDAVDSLQDAKDVCDTLSSVSIGPA